MSTQRGAKLYEGKAKIIYATERTGELLCVFKDDATAFDGAKKGTIQGKGTCNAAISAHLFRFLEEHGVATHFLALESATEMRVRRLTMFRLEVVMRNVAAGSLSKRLGLEEGSELPRPVLEFYLKDDALGDPLINRSHIDVLELASAEQVAEIEAAARRINELLAQRMAQAGIILVDFKLEFGVDGQGRIRLGDEISPDTCRFWDRETRRKLDKDRFRRDMGGVEDAYQEVWRRLQEVEHARG